MSRKKMQNNEEVSLITKLKATVIVFSYLFSLLVQIIIFTITLALICSLSMNTSKDVMVSVVFLIIMLFILMVANVIKTEYHSNTEKLHRVCDILNYGYYHVIKGQVVDVVNTGINNYTEQLVHIKTRNGNIEAVRFRNKPILYERFKNQDTIKLKIIAERKDIGNAEILDMYIEDNEKIKTGSR